MTNENTGNARLDLKKEQLIVTDNSDNKLIFSLNPKFVEVRDAHDKTLCNLPSSGEISAPISPEFADSMKKLTGDFKTRIEHMEHKLPTVRDLVALGKVATVGESIEVHPGDIPAMCKAKPVER